MWIMLTEMSGEKIAVNFNHVLSFNAYGTGARIVTLSSELTFFVRETIEEIEAKLGIEVQGR